MSTSALAAKPFAALLKKLRSRYEPEPYPPRDPITQLVLGFLQWEATRKQAEAALGRIHAAVVDNNELRVSHNHEIVAMIGPAYPRCEERVARLREAMQEIYVREHAVSLDGPATRGRKEIRTYIESLPGITPYVAAHVLVTALNVPVVPVDDKLAALLVAEGCVDEGTPLHQLAHLIEKNIKADDALATHLLLQAWSDDRKAPSSATRTAKKSAPAKKKK